MVLFTSRRCDDRGWVGVNTGVAPRMSITAARLELPPNCRICPGRNMAAVESLPAYCQLNMLMFVMPPVPLRSM